MTLAPIPEPAKRNRKRGWKFAGYVVLGLIAFGVINFMGCTSPVGHLERPTVDALENATRVEVFALSSPYEDGQEDKFKPSKHQIYGCNVIGQGKTQGSEVAHRLAAAILQRENFYIDDITCLVIPVICFRCWNGDRCVDAIVCFHCGQVALVSRNARGQAVQEHVIDCGPSGRKQLLALTREALPNDARLQAIRLD